MSIFRNVFKPRNAPESAYTVIPRSKLPDVNSFVEIAVGDDARQRESVSVDAIERESITTRRAPSMVAGATVDFLYTNAAGRFRFKTTCTLVEGTQAHFRIPTEVKTLADFAAKRTAVRLDSVIHVQWRYAPDGQGTGEYYPGTMSDVSRGGASIVVGKTIKKDSYLELKFTVPAADAPVIAKIQVMRVGKVEQSGKNTGGVRFVDLDKSAERAISEFIHHTQADRRERGHV